jgi:hypothetical protein
MCITPVAHVYSLPLASLPAVYHLLQVLRLSFCQNLD